MAKKTLTGIGVTLEYAKENALQIIDRIEHMSSDADLEECLNHIADIEGSADSILDDAQEIRNKIRVELESPWSSLIGASRDLRDNMHALQGPPIDTVTRDVLVSHLMDMIRMISAAPIKDDDDS